MNQPHRTDSLPILAVMFGTLLGMGLTAAAMLLLTDAGSPPPHPPPADSKPFEDPRGPERGPNALEWEVIRTYKVLENMTEQAPSHEVVDQALAGLRAYAEDHVGNPYVQELYLKGLRVAAYYAAEGGHEARSLALIARFADHASQAKDSEQVTVESMWLLAGNLRRGCANRAAEASALEALASRSYESERMARGRAAGLEAISLGGCSSEADGPPEPPSVLDGIYMRWVRSLELSR